MPAECSTDFDLFGRVEGRRVTTEFDGGAITSDAGGLLLKAMDRAIGLVERIAACFDDRRAPEPPIDFVRRPAEFQALKSKLLDARGDAVAISAALKGAGGYGKTTLAKALAHDPDILPPGNRQRRLAALPLPTRCRECRKRAAARYRADCRCVPGLIIVNQSPVRSRDERRRACRRGETNERRDRLEARRGVFGEFAAVAHSRRTLWYRLPNAPRQKPTCRAGVLHRLR